MQCKKCFADNTPGALLCEACGDLLEVEESVASSAAPPAPSASSSGSGFGQACRLVVAGQVTDKEIQLPQDDFEFLLGRTDLGEGIIPDVDLVKFGEKVTIEGKTGYTFSRKQAVLYRKMGRLFLKAIGSARTMHFSKQAWRTLGQNEETELLVGDRVRFGGSEGYVIFEIT